MTEESITTNTKFFEKVNVGFELNEQVKVKKIGVQGRVTGVWSSIDRVTKYSVQYYDTTGRMTTPWLAADEIEAIEENNQD